MHVLVSPHVRVGIGVRAFGDMSVKVRETTKARKCAFVCGSEIEHLHEDHCLLL